MDVMKLLLKEKPAPRSLLAAGRHQFFSTSRITERLDLQYGEKERLKLDIYEPERLTEETETIIFVHGGGWESGDKNIHRFLGRAWARRNYVVAIPNYRLVSDASYPAQMEDLTLALDWLNRNYEKFPDKFFLAGHSAGAHLASLLGFSRKWLPESGIRLARIAGFILLSGVYVFYPFSRADKRVQKFVGKKRYWEEAQPINHLRDTLPPVFITHGLVDEEVYPEQSVNLGDKLTEYNIRNELLLREDLDHIELLLDTAISRSEFWSAVNDFFF